jgi:hypothetical protein
MAIANSPTGIDRRRLLASRWSQRRPAFVGPPEGKGIALLLHAP